MAIYIDIKLSLIALLYHIQTIICIVILSIRSNMN